MNCCPEHIMAAVNVPTSLLYVSVCVHVGFYVYVCVCVCLFVYVFVSVYNQSYIVLATEHLVPTTGFKRVNGIFGFLDC